MNRKPEIAFFGSSLVSAYWNGAATYYRGIIRALNAKGYRITFYEPDAYERQQHRDIPDPPWAKVRVYPATEDAVYQMLELASQADIAIKASGVGVFDELLEKSVLEIRRPGASVIFWDVDAPATLDRIGKNRDDSFRALIPQYDLVLTYGGGAPVVNAYLGFGARECVPIYNALDPDTHFPAKPDSRFSGDISFLGNRLPDREDRVRELFLKPAGLWPEGRFVLGGNGWDGNGLPPNVRFLGHVYTKDHNAFNCSSKAVLNISRNSMAKYGYSPATRLFEAAGAGACIISDRWRGIEQFLEPGHEVLLAGDGAEVIDCVRSLTPARARSIGEGARRRVLAEHTYTHRASELEELFGRL